jgi:C1A family cysteine protease
MATKGKMKTDTPRTNIPRLKTSRFTLISHFLPFLLLAVFFSVSSAQETKILPDDGGAEEEFGYAVSVSGDYSIIGAYKDNDRGTGSGSAYIFRREGAEWMQQAKLTAADGMSHNYFGCSVSVSGDRAGVGAFNNSGKAFGAGSVYVFRRSGTAWIQETKLSADDGAENDYFGYAVSVSGNALIAGAYRDDDKGGESGSAYIFRYDGATWIQEAKLSASDGAAGDNFGRAVSISGDYALIGALHDSDKGNHSGAAYIFSRSGTGWIQQAKLVPADLSSNDFFGFAVSLSIPYAAVSSVADDDRGYNSGSVYIFRRASDGRWIQETKLGASDGSANRFFGRSVSLSGPDSNRWLGVGADGADAAYLFKSENGVWVEQTTFRDWDSASGNGFGWSLSVSAQNTDVCLIAGAYKNSDQGKASGAAYIYSSLSGTPGVPDIDVSPTQLDFRRPAYTRSAEKNSEKNSEKDDAPPSDENCGRGLVIPESAAAYWQMTPRPPRKPASQSLPESTDWSGYDSGVRSQGSCGSCWAFAAVALAENLSNQANLPIDPDLSEQTLVSCAVGGCSGGWYWDALNYIYKEGVGPESCYPYTGAGGDCQDRCVNPDFLLKIREFTASPGRWGEDISADDLKEALQEGPLCVSMRVPDDGTFTGSGYTGGVYDYDGGFISWEKNGHSVLLVGYDDRDQCFKAKNSWGTRWGENGYFRIAYDDVTDDVKFGSYGVSASGLYLDAAAGTFTISNKGNADLHISGISVSRNWIRYLPQTVPTIPPGGKQVINVSVSSWDAVAAPEEQGEISIYSDDPDEASVRVSVKAVKDVKDGAGADIPTLLVSPPFKEAQQSGGTFEIHVSKSGGGTMDWSAQTDTSWLSVQSGSSGLNDGIVSISYQTNNWGYRRGKVMISALNALSSPQFVEVRQAGLYETADTDGSGSLDLKDALLALRLLSGCEDCGDIVAWPPYPGSDANGDSRIGMEEVIYILRRLSEPGSE